MAQQLTVTEMMRSFSDVISQVYYQGKSFDIKKGSKIVAKLTPSRKKSGIAVKDLEKFLLSGPRLDDEDAKDFEKAVSYARSFKDNKDYSKWE